MFARATNVRGVAVCDADVLTPIENWPTGGAAKNLDWLSNEPQASAVCGGAAAAEGDLDLRFVVPPDVGVHGCDELVDRRGQPVAREEHPGLQTTEEALARGVVR